LAESAAWNSEQPVTLIARTNSSFELPEWLAERDVSVVAMPHLLYGLGRKHLAEVLKFVQLVEKSRAVVILGADVMDGRYNAIASVNRWSLALLARAGGATSSVLGFSWNSSPNGSSVAGLRKAGASVQLWVRDPASLARVESLGAVDADLCADIVFAHPAPTLPAQFGILPSNITRRMPASGDYAIVNASSYVGSDQHVTSEYRSILKKFEIDGTTVIFLPHVMRLGSDLECLRPLFNAFSGTAVLVDELLTPTQVAHLVKNAKIVITGRMHLAVLSALVRTPVLTMSTQGKVDGLYELFGRPDWVLEAGKKFSERVIIAIEELSSSDDAFPSDQAMNNIRELSCRPFGGSGASA
jgi:polysaccharide pyruvyl transferase WcaK-like protein